jgi:sulfite reductase beta subunit-like hemoprotein
METTGLLELTQEDEQQSLELSIAHLPPEVRSEIERFHLEIERLERGELEADDFKKFRLQNGVYGIRGTTDLHMIRVKVRFGEVTPEQLEALASIAEDFTPNKICHVTTRQDFQFHWIERRDVPRILARIANSGLTTREACGNTVRNVTACPYAGISPSELFDVTPYADALSRHFLRNPINQNLPRKFKIAFEGCADDHARTPIHDFGAVAAVRDVGGQFERGFRVYVGGGLGAQPRSAELLEEFTPADLLIPTAEAVIRVFDRHGERRPEHTHRMRARLKFLIKAWGFEKLRREILIERRAILATRSGLSEFHIEPIEERPPDVSVPNRDPLGWQPSGEYKQWLKTNAIPQKQTGWYAVTVRCPLGDISAEGLRAVAAIARRYSGGRMRTAISQNLLLRWVPESALPWVYRDLERAGLAVSQADRIADITRCPGADTCQLAITHSRGLAESLGGLFTNGLASAPEIQDISIKISGCMNSCGQHHIADLGFYGASSNEQGHELPEYILLIGGRTKAGQAKFGKAIAKIPARRVPEAAHALLDYYRSTRRPGEPFAEFVDRVEVNVFKQLLDEFTKAPPYTIAPEMYQDLGTDGSEFKVEVGLGECAS